MSETSPEQPSLPSSPDEQGGGGWTITRVAFIAAVVFIGIVLSCFASGLGLAALSGTDQAGEIIRLVRDIFIIVLSMISILIVIALAVLIIQIAGLVSLLQTEIKPLLENMQDTLNTAKGTMKFVGANVASPLIKAGGFLAGVGVFMRELGGIRRAIRPEPNTTQNGADDARKPE